MVDVFYNDEGTRGGRKKRKQKHNTTCQSREKGKIRIQRRVMRDFRRPHIRLVLKKSGWNDEKKREIIPQLTI